jgi:hypothetical protein
MPPSKHHSIRLRLRELAQLFNSMDPSPFLDRDIDVNAEEFIVSSARELSSSGHLQLIIHLEITPPADRAAETENAVQRYFASRAEMKQREFSQLMRRGRTSLLVGLAFLITCLTISEVVDKLSHGAAVSIVKEGLTIGGWVAMWRPLEIYLYDWWPLSAQRKLLRRLSAMTVRLITQGA